MMDTTNQKAFWDGFFHFFGFIDNPAEKASNEIVQKSSANKIREDLKRVNKDFRSKYEEMKALVLGC